MARTALVGLDHDYAGDGLDELRRSCPRRRCDDGANRRRATTSAATAAARSRTLAHDAPRDLTVATSTRRLFFLLLALLGFCIDRALRDLRQQLVRVPLFIERLLQKVRLLVEPELSRVRSYRAIARHLVMLDVLCFRDETGVEHLLGCVLLEQFLRFFDQSLHSFALLSRRAFAEHLEDLLEPLDVPFRFLKMIGERLLQLRIRRILDHLWQCLHDLLFGAVEVPEFLEVQLLQ